MIYVALAVLLPAGFYPIQRARRGNRRTTLRHAAAWAGFAWAAWCFAVCLSAAQPAIHESFWRYVALCMTGCAAVAVLGARRPGAAAWNFVVAGLLAVLLLPAMIQLGEPRLNSFDAVFLAATLAVGLLNYLPTRFFAVVLFVGAACALEMANFLRITADKAIWVDQTALALLAAAPWLGYAAARRWQASDEVFDREWLAFRDRFGMVWALPARDQFNRAAVNNHWDVLLDWKGLRPAEGAAMVHSAAALAGLRAVLKRFETDEDRNAGSTVR